MRNSKSGPKTKKRAATLMAAVAWGLGFATSLLSHHAQAQAAPASTSVDNFDDNDVSDWKPFEGKGAILERRISSSRATTGMLSMKMTYTIPAGGYTGVEKILPTPANWSGANALTFAVNGLATGHRFRVQLYDAGSERFEYAFTVGFNGWQQVTIPFNAFMHAGFQPAGAKINNVLDRNGIRGIALIPCDSAGTGAVYIDSMALSGATSATAPATTATPAKPATPATAAKPATPAAPLPPPASTTPSGTIIPLYSYPSPGAWDSVINAKKAYPKVPVLAVVNPNSGPGYAADSAYMAGIAKLTGAGVKAIGYVATTYGNKSVANVEAEISRWRSLYPATTGIFFDEMTNRAGAEAYYKTITNFAHSHGFNVTIGNPGTDVAKSFIGSVDVILVYEAAGLPSTASMGGWHASYDKHNFGIIPYGVAMNRAYVTTVRQTIGYIYLQGDTMPHPWDTVTPYLADLLSALNAG